ncbi:MULTISPECIES: hypothetical protein [Streptomyces]|jgi:hypothetical protein|nr:hypothetical protein [Streptomyces sp. WAC05292]
MRIHVMRAAAVLALAVGLTSVAPMASAVPLGRTAGTAPSAADAAGSLAG